MARDFPLFYNLEATEFFAAVESIMGSQEPGRVPDQGGQQPPQHVQCQQQAEVQHQMQHMNAGQPRGQHSES
eukprot:9449385-Prorocentrum_lima.AAC.1